MFASAVAIFESLLIIWTAHAPSKSTHENMLSKIISSIVLISFLSEQEPSSTGYYKLPDREARLQVVSWSYEFHVMIHASHGSILHLGTQ